MQQRCFLCLYLISTTNVDIAFIYSNYKARASRCTILLSAEAGMACSQTQSRWKAMGNASMAFHSWEKCEEVIVGASMAMSMSD